MLRRPAFVHFLAGLVLLLILVPLTGWLAAIPTPPGLVELLREHRSLAVWGTHLVVQFLPVLVVSFVFGLLAFRLLREASGRAVAWMSAGALVPLCGLQIAVMLLHGSGAAAFGALFGDPLYWFSTIPLPLGLWLAARRQRIR